jgi:hypothetical protein
MVHSVLANKIAYGKIADIQGDPQRRSLEGAVKTAQEFNQPRRKQQ